MAWLALVAVAVLVGGAAVAFVATRDQSLAVDASPSTPPTPAVTESAAPSNTPTPTPTPTPSPTPPAKLAPCPTGDPFQRVSTSELGRVSGGGISYAIPWAYQEIGSVRFFTFATDAAGMQRLVVGDPSSASSWVSVAVVMSVASEKFTGLEQAARSVSACTLKTDAYAGVLDSPIIDSRSFPVAGGKAWLVRREVHVADPQVPGDILDTIVVDVGKRGGEYGVFSASSPIGNRAMLAQMERTENTLRVD